MDETNKIATLVWEYRHTPDISAPCFGSVKRFDNGNTLIGWGCAIPTSGTIATEVSSAGTVVFEVKHQTAPGSSSLVTGNGLTKQLWNSPGLTRSTSFQEIVPGQIYDSAEAGVSVTVSNLTGEPENALMVQRHLDAVRFPQFSGKAPQVLMEHVVLSGSNILDLNAELTLDLPDTRHVFDTPIIHDPVRVVVYQRPTPGSGQFSALPTTYDPETQKVRVTSAHLGEFIFTSSDVPETPYVPSISSPTNQTHLGQTGPVTMVWIPRGLVGSFDLQVATDAEFNSLVVDTNGLSISRYVLPSTLPNTQYFWRVRVVNQGGTSDWASASFTVTSPMLHVIYPAGGEVWQRFQVVTIRWDDNISENVAIDIYKGGVSNRTIVASTPSTGSYTWTVGQFQAFASDWDYSLKIRSTTNPTLYDFSPPFSLITNVTDMTIHSSTVTYLPNERFQFGFTIPGALQASIMVSTNLHDWQVLQVLQLVNGSAVFTDVTVTNRPYRFYRLRVP